MQCRFCSDVGCWSEIVVGSARVYDGVVVSIAVLCGRGVMHKMGGDWKRGMCSVTLIIIFVHYFSNFRPSSSHLCFVFVFLATVAGISACGMVDMALTWIWARNTGVIVGDVVSTAPAIIPIFVVLDGIRVSLPRIESLLLCWLLCIWMVGGSCPLLLLAWVVALLICTASALTIAASAFDGASECAVAVVLLHWWCLCVLLLLHLRKWRLVVHGRLCDRGGLVCHVVLDGRWCLDTVGELFHLSCEVSNLRLDAVCHLCVGGG